MSDKDNSRDGEVAKLRHIAKTDHGREAEAAKPHERYTGRVLAQTRSYISYRSSATAQVGP